MKPSASKGQGDGHFVYILRCADGTLYTGWTNDLAKRLQVHNEGRGAKYTRGRGPVTLVYQHSYDTKEEALREEIRIKKLTRRQKEALIKEESNQHGAGTDEQCILRKP